MLLRAYCRAVFLRVGSQESKAGPGVLNEGVFKVIMSAYLGIMGMDVWLLAVFD